MSKTLAPKTDGVLAWAKRLRKEWQRTVDRLQRGLMTTSEVQKGKIVDTTEEELNHLIVRLAELEALVLKHESHNA